ncbi:MAG TPA: FtsX-like permease family protein [Candidatus Bathyarchaeia archaeon]|nr:FtsX-like permease family protein [Candidatus Bathyarchaeia archaeon]
MFVLDNIKLATRNFKTRKLRTFLTILGISVGIGTILFLVSLGYGLQKILIERLATSDTLLTLDVSAANTTIIKIDDAFIGDMKNIPNVVEVSPQKSVFSELKIGDISSNISFSAVNNSFFHLSGLNLLKGEMFGNDKDNKIIVSTGSLKSLGMDDPVAALGKEVTLTLIVPQNTSSDEKEMNMENTLVPLDGSFVISGIVEDDASSAGYLPIGWVDSSVVPNFDSVKVKVTDQNSLDPVRSVIIDKGLAVSSLSDTVDQASKIFNVVQIVLSLFGIIALIVSAIGMFNTMTIALLERTSEIGIMKSLGASNREIQFLFLTESILIGLLGGLGGILIGKLGTWGFDYGFFLLAKSFGGQAINIFYTPTWFILFIIAFSAIVGFITGVYPARRASRLNALTALRYK